MNDDIYIFICPYCHEDIVVIKKELNCRIFRHGVLKSNYEQVNPHATLQECEYLITNNLIFGCGKPFQIIEKKNGELEAVICGYI